MEYNTLSDKSNQTKYLTDNNDHSFTWQVICNIPDKKLERKLIETYFTATMKPSLSDKIDSDLLLLFRNGIT